MTLWQSKFIIQGTREAFGKLNPFTLWRNAVMLVVEIGSVITTAATVKYILAGESYSLSLQVSLWLWATVIFSNFAEALAEIQGKARAESLRSTRNLLNATRLLENGETETLSAGSLKRGDVVMVKEGEVIPGDGDIIEGTALVDESAITGESAPVIRESGGDRCGVTGGTKVLSGAVTVRITVNPGETFLDNMIKMVESAKRQKTPNEIALEILLVSLTALFIVVVATLPFFARYMGVVTTVPILISLLVCLMPTTIGGLLPAIGIAGMDRLLQHNVIAMSGKAVEAAGDVNTVLLDKTGTITLGNRMATEFIPEDDVHMTKLARAALYSSLADETPEGRSIVVLAKRKLGIHGRDIRQPENSTFIPFTPESGMSGIDMDGVKIRKGAAKAIKEYLKNYNAEIPFSSGNQINLIGMTGGTPLAVVENSAVIGVIRLQDVVKQGIAARLADLRRMGIQSVMITGDNQLTAASIAAEAGVDDFLAQAKPETKLEVIRKYQQGGRMVAMIGDGTNDAPALAQADVAVAMNAGTQAAREAANMIDLDSSPTKLLDIVEIGKEILITRGALTTFSIANDVAKYFAIIPALFAATYPELGILNLMRLSSPASAVLAAVIFNALIIPMLIPLAMRGVRYRVTSVSSLLLRNFLIYGIGGLLLPFAGIKIIDFMIDIFHLV
ncbi:MAG: potassium-transporting ATPase subunit KdpB [Spirochaetes bacterium]|jgi:K+-transporting ATPase ATPase B chain|nr:potassium-transporting ATPase subunit KdpB [Spirochaetota bacterium]